MPNRQDIINQEAIVQSLNKDFHSSDYLRESQKLVDLRTQYNSTSFISSSVISSTSIDWNIANNFITTLTASQSFSFVNQNDGQIINICVINNASYTVSWTESTIKWNAGTPVQSVSATDLYTFIKIGSFIYGSAAQGF